MAYGIPPLLRHPVVPLTAVLGLGLLLSGLFFQYYYLALFHSDSAAIQVLAAAVAQENSPLPQDFNYGNQLILFRAELPIALLLKLGFSGYQAFSLGSTLNILLYLLLSALAIQSVLRRWKQALALAVLLFLPIGLEESDYVLGQQSHLANVCFALITVTQTWRLLTERDFRPILFPGLAVFAMAVESPARALLVIVPLLLVAALRAPRAKVLLCAMALGVPFLPGYLINSQLVALHHVVGLTGLGIATLPQALDNLGTLLAMIWSDYFGTGHFRIANDAVFYLPFTALKILFLCAAPPAALFPGREPRALFLLSVGGCGLIVGMIATALLIPLPDIRHFLWALEILKLGLYLALWQLAERYFGARIGAAALCLLAAGLCTPLVTPLYPPNRALLAKARDDQFATPPRQFIAEQMQRLGIHKIYGHDFWKTLRLEVLFPPAEAGVLGVWGDKIGYTDWLTRPSLRCPQGDVLYWLGAGDADRKILDAVLASGGAILFRSGADRLLAGPPVWERAGC